MRRRGPDLAIGGALLGGLLFLGCGARPGVVPTAEPTTAATEAEAGSIILRSTHILLGRIVSARPGEWLPGPRQTRQRTAQLTLAIEAVLKGDAAGAAGTEVPTTVSQVEIVGSRVFAVPGVWSGKTLAPGVRYLVFGRSDSREPVEIVREANTIAVSPADEALEDVRWIMDGEKKRRPLPKTLARWIDQKRAPGPLAVEYIAARLPAIMYGDPTTFSRMMDWLESPGLPERCRETLVEAVSSRLLLDDPAPDPFVARTVVGSFRLLARAESSALANSLVGTYLPNLLGIEGGATAKTASSIFLRFPEERAKAHQALRAFTGPADTARLQQWLNR